MTTTTYKLTELDATDPSKVHGWNYRITVYHDDEEITDTLYKTITDARSNLQRRSQLAKDGGRAGTVIVIDNTQGATS